MHSVSKRLHEKRSHASSHIQENGRNSKEKKVKKRCGSLRRDYDLVQISQLPSNLCHNHYIQKGYRPALSLAKAIKSIFHLHNGT
jgi:hypothetical protein